MKAAFIALGFVLYAHTNQHDALTRLDKIITSFSASAKSFRIFSSDAPTYLFKISGPLTILGSRAFNIFPICLAIKVLPVPGGPCSKIPICDNHRYMRIESTTQRPTFHMLDSELFDESWREHTRCKRTTEDSAELRV